MNSNEKQIVREVLASMADEAPPPVSFESLEDTHVIQEVDPPRRSALVAAFAGFVVIVVVIGGAVAVTQRSTPDAGPSPTTQPEDTVPHRSLDKDTIYGVWEVIEFGGAPPIGRPGVMFSVVPRFNASVNNAELGQAGAGSARPRYLGFGGCNNFGGTYTVDGDRVASHGAGGTLRGCAGEVEVQEVLFIELIGGADWFIDNGLLTLTGDSGTVAVLREVDTNPAVGVWQLAELDGKLPASDISLDLSERGAIYGYSGCFIFGSYLVDGDELTLSTDPPVEEPPELVCDGGNEEEIQLRSLLLEGRGTATGDELRFTSDTGASAVFHRA